MVFTVNTAPLFRILVLSMSFFLSLDMQSDKNNNEVSSDNNVIRVNREDECAVEAVLASGSGLRGPRVKLWDVGDITTPTYPGHSVTVVSSCSSSVHVPSRAHLGITTGIGVSHGGIQSDASQSGDKEVSFGHDCAIITQKQSPADSSISLPPPYRSPVCIQSGAAGGRGVS